MSLRAVAFDIDGTLYPNSSMYRVSLPFVVRNLGLMRAFGRVRKRIRDMRPVEDFYRAQAELLGVEMGTNPDTAGQLLDERVYGQWERLLHRVELYPFVRECIESFRAAGLYIAVCSDFPVKTKLDVLGLSDINWDLAFSTEEIGYLKPNPEPFAHIARELGIPPGAVVYVGNSYKYDIVGAKFAGMLAAHLTKRPAPNSIADFSFTRFEDLRDWVLESDSIPPSIGV
ncbi:MAG: HAD family hydrolase [Spirochaeta sp.]|nr:HAD family hydrolase [Spirochaeta sp.]